MNQYPAAPSNARPITAAATDRPDLLGLVGNSTLQSGEGGDGSTAGSGVTVSDRLAAEGSAASAGSVMGCSAPQSLQNLALPVSSSPHLKQFMTFSIQTRVLKDSSDLALATSHARG